MRKGQTRPLRSRTRWQQTTTGAILVGLIVCAVLASQAILLHFHTLPQTTPSPTPTPGQSYLYYVLKTPTGFVLARARKGLNAQPAETPQQVPDFGKWTRAQARIPSSICICPRPFSSMQPPDPAPTSLFTPPLRVSTRAARSGL